MIVQWLLYKQVRSPAVKFNVPDLKLLNIFWMNQDLHIVYNEKKKLKTFITEFIIKNKTKHNQKL